MPIQLLSAAANIPRTEYDPVTGALMGLLIEGSRTNLLIYSSQFDNPAWTLDGSTIAADAVTAPDGTVTGNKVIATATTAVHRVYQNSGLAVNAKAAASCYAKKGELTKIAIILYSVGLQTTCIFDLAAGTYAYGGPAADVLMRDVGNGWYRIGLAKSPASGQAQYARFNLCDAGSNVSFTGDGVSGLYLWGTQLEQGNFPTSSISTTSAQVTRSDDLASLNAAWANPAAGAFVAEFQLECAAASLPEPGVVASIQFDSASNGGGFTAFEIRLASSAVIGRYVNGLSVVDTSVSIALGARQAAKVAAAFDASSVRISINGAPVSTAANTSGVPTAPTVFTIGNQVTNHFLYGWVKDLKYLPYSPSDADLQALST